MAVRPHQFRRDVTNRTGKTQLELAKAEHAKRERARELRERDIEETLDAASRGWVSIVPRISDPKGSWFFPSRKRYLKEAIFHASEPYVWQEDEEELRIIRADMWAQEILESVRTSPKPFTLPHPVETENSRANYFRHQDWLMKIRVLKAAAISDHQRFFWNKDWYDAKIFRICGVCMKVPA